MHEVLLLFRPDEYDDSAVLSVPGRLCSLSKDTDRGVLNLKVIRRLYRWWRNKL
jgi:hypothetical protein